MKVASSMAVVTIAAMLVARAADEPPKPPKEEPSKIYGCRDAAGNIVYQGEPCAEPSPAPAPTPRPALPPKARHAPAPPAPRTPEARVPAAPPSAPSSPPAPIHHGVPTSLRGDGRTPAGVLRRFLDGVTSGDRAAVASCLTAAAQDRLLAGDDRVWLDTLRASTGAFTGYVDEGDLGPYWSIRALRAHGRPKWILFTRSADGEWKISNF